MQRLTLAIAILLTISLPASAVTLRVGVLRASKPSSITIYCRAGLITTTASGKQTHIAGSRVITIALPTQSIIVSGKSNSPITVKSSNTTARYRGKLRISSHLGRLLIVNEVSLEDYVRGVVANEMHHEWPTEALKAQAVLARTLAIERLTSHSREGFDICDTTHCQVYRGALTETPSTDAAVRATSAQILTFHGDPIQALYSSCCGGLTANAYASKSLGNTPYLAVTKDQINGASACKPSPHFSWTYRVTAPNLAAALQSDPRTNPGAHFQDLRIIRSDSSHRAVYVSIKGDRPHEVDAYVLYTILCRRLGWGSIKSAQFTVIKSGNTYRFQGHGLGHGIGMCQWGALKRANNGWSYRRILDFYYPGAKLSQPRVEKCAHQP